MFSELLSVTVGEINARKSPQNGLSEGTSYDKPVRTCGWMCGGHCQAVTSEGTLAIRGEKLGFRMATKIFRNSINSVYIVSCIMICMHCACTSGSCYGRYVLLLCGPAAFKFFGVYFHSPNTVFYPTDGA